MNKTLKTVAAVFFACLAFASCDDDGDIIGLNDAAKYGYIKVTIEGTRPDGETYTETKNFRFSPSTAPAYGSAAWIYNDTYKEFYVSRFIGAINESYEGEENKAELRLYVDGSGAEPNFVESGLRLETSIVTDDKKFFFINEYFYIEDNSQVTDYNYNQETGKLSFKFTATSEDNSGNDIRITVNTNVTVFRSMNINL